MRDRNPTQGTSANLNDSPTVNSVAMPAGVASRGRLTLFIGMSAFALWAWLAPLSGAVVVEGVVKPEGERKVVQHHQGGIIRSVLVHEGDTVASGQVLALLDPTRNAADLDAKQVSYLTLSIKAARLSAEHNLQSAVTWPVVNPPASLENAKQDLITREATAFDTRRKHLLSQLGLLQQQLENVNEEVKIALKSAAVSRASWLNAKEEVALNERLRAQGFISTARLLQLNRDQMDYQGKYQAQLAEMNRARQRHIELELRQSSLRSDYMKQAADELKDTTRQLLTLAEEIKPLADAVSRLEIRSPVAGIVMDLKVHTIGTVIAAREPLMEIVPVESPLIVEAKVKPENIAQVRVGSRADIRLTAFKQRITPTVEGSVYYVDADRLEDPATKLPHYAVRISIEPRSIEKATKLTGKSVALGAGMSAEIFIRTERRTAFDYLAEPIYSGILRSMRE